MKQLSVFLILLTSLHLCAQTPGHYLFSKDIQQAADRDSNAFQLQNYATKFSKIGNYKASLAEQQVFLVKAKAMVNEPDKPLPDSAWFATFHPENAVAVIAREAQHYQVVITNEAHYQPQNRVFTRLLLKKLYSEGFRYLCVEDLNPTDSVMRSKADSGLNQRKYPTFSSGFFMDEPQYGNLVRAALQIGYTLVAYEHSGLEKKDPADQLVAREEGQAANIARILDKDPKAKILVHCGYGHLNKQVKDNYGHMGALLQLRHHINPLTIDQQDMLEENKDPVYRWAHVKEPSIFVSDRRYYNDSTAFHVVDMDVFFPPVTYINGRPDWLVYDKSRKYYFLPRLNPAAYPAMVFAYHQEEDLASAIPADIIELDSIADGKALVLDKGGYIIQVRDTQNQLVRQETVKINQHKKETKK